MSTMQAPCDRHRYTRTDKTDTQTDAQVRGGAGDPDTRTPGALPRRLAVAHRGLSPCPLRPPARGQPRPPRDGYITPRAVPLSLSLPPVPAPGKERGRPRPRAQGGAVRQGSSCGPRVCLPLSLASSLPSFSLSPSHPRNVPPAMGAAAPWGAGGARSASPATAHLPPRPRHTFPGAPPLPPALPGRVSVRAVCVCAASHRGSPSSTDGRTHATAASCPPSSSSPAPAALLSPSLSPHLARCPRHGPSSTPHPLPFPRARHGRVSRHQPAAAARSTNGARRPGQGLWAAAPPSGTPAGREAPGGSGGARTAST